MLRYIAAGFIIAYEEARQAVRSRRTRGRVVEDPNRLGYHLMAGGTGAPPRDPLLDVASEETWREIEREAMR